MGFCRTSGLHKTRIKSYGGQESSLFQIHLFAGAIQVLKFRRETPKVVLMHPQKFAYLGDDLVFVGLGPVELEFRRSVKALQFPLLPGPSRESAVSALVEPAADHGR